MQELFVQRMNKKKLTKNKNKLKFKTLYHVIFTTYH